MTVKNLQYIFTAICKDALIVNSVQVRGIEFLYHDTYYSMYSACTNQLSASTFCTLQNHRWLRFTDKIIMITLLRVNKRHTFRKYWPYASVVLKKPHWYGGTWYMKGAIGERHWAVAQNIWRPCTVFHWKSYFSNCTYSERLLSISIIFCTVA